MTATNFQEKIQMPYLKILDPNDLAPIHPPRLASNHSPIFPTAAEYH